MIDVSTGVPAIALIDVVKTFDDGLIPALNGVTLDITPGEFVAITGPSGCGKSTLLHLIAALDIPTSGEIRVNGNNLRSIGTDRYRRGDVGLIFQLHNLLPHLSAIENIEVAMFSNGTGYSEQRERARELLASVGLSAKENTPPPKLSGGERQRLAIARALANDPAIVLADEPTGNLDSEASERLLALFQRIRKERGSTILLVTHDRDVAAAADRVISMRDGRIVRADEVQV
jgi:putative ABC transport system ATP-binding protein